PHARGPREPSRRARCVSARRMSSAPELEHQAHAAIHAARPPRGLGACFLVSRAPDLRPDLGGDTPGGPDHHVAAQPGAEADARDALGLVARAGRRLVLELRLARPPLDAGAEEDVGPLADAQQSIAADAEVER